KRDWSSDVCSSYLRTCQELNKKSVAVYASPDAEAPHVLQADESVHIGPAASKESYLVIDKIIRAAKDTGANAIHPGYGFLSENAAFSQRCKDEGIVFIARNPHAINTIGDKTAARKLRNYTDHNPSEIKTMCDDNVSLKFMSKANVTILAGTQKELKDFEETKHIADNIRYPVLVRAAARGGDKGMRIIESEEEFKSSIKP